MLAGIKERWRSVRAELFPKLVLLDLSDAMVLTGQAFKPGGADSPVWTAPVPARTVRSGVPIAADALGDFIGDLLLEHSTPDASLAVALPQAASQWRLIEWPAGTIPEDPVEALREMNPDLQLPFRLDEAYIDIQDVPASPSRSVLVAAPRGTVEAWINLFAIAGGSLRHLLPAQAARMAGLREAIEASPPGGMVALLQPLASRHQLEVWVDGAPEFERSLPLESQALVPALTQSITYCQERFSPSSTRLLLAQPFEGSDAVAQALEFPIEPVDLGGFGSLVLKGLADVELTR
ncbi:MULTISPECIES: hypothetical protein [Aphanothece]|uniref:hypothetical protein n=1 Tax=Aphanothece stagnina TaxID=1004305 RepID=UPI0039849775